MTDKWYPFSTTSSFNQFPTHSNPCIEQDKEFNKQPEEGKSEEEAERAGPSQGGGVPLVSAH